jgi:dethiobiotin synthetase
LKERGFFIAGTDTGVGKTTIAAAIAFSMKKRGINVGVMKPFATASGKYSSRFNSEDAAVLSSVADVCDRREKINPYFTTLATAPYTASLVKKTERVDFPRTVRSYSELASIHDMMIVEGIGGILVPLTRKKNLADFAKAINLPLIVVARFRLGMINHILLTLAACLNYDLKVKGIILNDLSRWEGPVKKKAIVKTIEKVSGFSVLAILPFFENAAPNIVAHNLESFLRLNKKLSWS